MGKVAKRPVWVAVMAIGIAGGLALAGVAAFVLMIWTVFQLLMLPF